MAVFWRRLTMSQSMQRSMRRFLPLCHSYHIKTVEWSGSQSDCRSNLEQQLIDLTVASTQALIASLFSLPTHSTPSGPAVNLPTPKTLLPREKPVPKPKPLTKWERFAKEKGISHKKKEKKIWDEERQEWVNRWGRDGKNKEKEDQWIHEVKAGEGMSPCPQPYVSAVPADSFCPDAEQDPAAAARKERKARMAKNSAQHAANLALSTASQSLAASSSRRTGNGDAASSVSAAQRAALRTARKAELERSMLVSKTSTASMGKFDKKIEGEPKAKGVKRKFDANENVKDEASKMKSVLKSVERGESKKVKKGGEGKDGDINARKAVRFEGREARKAARAGGGGGDAKRGGRGGKRR